MLGGVYSFSLPSLPTAGQGQGVRTAGVSLSLNPDLFPFERLAPGPAAGYLLSTFGMYGAKLPIPSGTKKQFANR